MSRYTFRRCIIICSIVLAVGSALGLAALLWKMRSGLIDRATIEVANLSDILGQHIQQSTRAADLLLDDVTDYASRLHNRNQDIFPKVIRDQPFYNYLTERNSRLPTVDGVTITDDKGIIVASSHGLNCCAVTDLSDRDYFTAISDRTTNETYVSRPLISRVSGRPTIVMSRRITGRRGEFLGIAALGFSPEKLLARNQPSHNTGRLVTLMRRDGTVLARSNNTFIGEVLPWGSKWHTIVAAGGGAYNSPGHFDGVNRLVGIQPIDKVPFVVNVLLPVSEALATWWPVVIASVIAYIIIAGIMMVLLRMLLSQLDKTTTSEARLQVIASQDDLTKLPNRQQFLTALKQSIDKSKQNADRGAVLFIDLDRFKNVNDSLGHAAGDELLQLVAARLLTTLRQCDVLARLGGDEFVVLLERSTETIRIDAVATRLIDALQQPFNLADKHEIYISGSIGIAAFPDDSDQPDVLIQQADTALYQAKEAGGSTFRYYDKVLTTAANKRLELEGRMRQAMEHGEFVLYYQPIFEVATRQIVGVEALIRWNDPIRGLVPPLEFIPLAEKTGFILQLGDWVLRTACDQMKLWRERGIAIETMAMNLSARQFQQPHLHARLAEIIKTTNVPSESLILEITESTLIEDGPETLQRLEQIRSLGVQLAIDDFGTGYSSLSYLRRFPISQIKIDRSFVRDIAIDDAAMQIVAAMLALANTLDLQIVAEGIETEQQFACLHQMGCELGQGYLIAKPMPAELFEQFYRASVGAKTTVTETTTGLRAVG
jgi:diguanylate cyclase (GGDEF)-like protein